MARWWRWAALSFAFWTAIAVIFSLPRLAQGGSWQVPLFSALANWWSWGMLAPVIIAVDRRLPFKSREAGKRLLTHLVLGPVLTMFYIYLFAALTAAMRLQPWSVLSGSHLFATALQGELFWGMLVYSLIVGVSEVYLYHQRSLSAELQMKRLERNFSAARLNALRMQLDPHFLFNALNTISAQVEREPRLARTMIEHLGDLLRLSLDSHGRDRIALAEELAFLDHYLAIQRIRFGDKLKVALQIAPEVKHVAVPSLFMQPLVENAIRHGISRRAHGGLVTVIAERVEDQLEIKVLDDGIGLPAGWSLETGVGLGLSVTRERIAGLYPEGTTRFALSRRADGGTQVEISFPIRSGLNDEEPSRV